LDSGNPKSVNSPTEVKIAYLDILDYSYSPKKANASGFGGTK